MSQHQALSSLRVIGKVTFDRGKILYLLPLLNGDRKVQREWHNRTLGHCCLRFRIRATKLREGKSFPLIRIWLNNPRVCPPPPAFRKSIDFGNKSGNKETYQYPGFGTTGTLRHQESCLIIYILGCLTRRLEDTSFSLWFVLRSCWHYWNILS